MQTADKRPRLFERSEFLGRRRAFYRHLTAWRVASATCPTRAGSNEQQSVRFAALQINFFTATAILAMMNELGHFRFASTILNPRPRYMNSSPPFIAIKPFQNQFHQRRPPVSSG